MGVEQDIEQRVNKLLFLWRDHVELEEAFRGHVLYFGDSCEKTVLDYIRTQNRLVQLDALVYVS